MYLTNIKRLLTRSQKKKYLYHETRQRTWDVVVMDRSKYIEKCLHILQTEQFTKLSYIPVSNPGSFYGTAKLYKFPTHGTIEELPIRPIVSNKDTASYRLAKHSAKNLSPLGKSTYTINPI